MAVTVEVRKVVHREGNKNGKPWAMDFVTCIVTDDAGEEAVGEFILPKGHPAVSKGIYAASLKVGSVDGRIGFGIASLQPKK